MERENERTAEGIKVSRAGEIFIEGLPTVVNSKVQAGVL
jgi:hypothetical protein